MQSRQSPGLGTRAEGIKQATQMPAAMLPGGLEYQGIECLPTASMGTWMKAVQLQLESCPSRNRTMWLETERPCGNSKSPDL